MPQRRGSRVGGVLAIVGSLLLLLATYLHPIPDNPNDAVVAFTMYAADRLWIASHLGQLAGFGLMMGSLLVFGDLLENRRELCALAASGAIASLAVATVLQAVDGIALKSMVDAWVVAPAAEKASAFHAAMAVRQIEIGLDSTLSLLGGLTVLLYGLALLGERSYPKWLGALAIIGGLATAVAGVAMAYTGYSDLTMDISMPASCALLIWIFVLGIIMCRARPGAVSGAKY